MESLICILLSLIVPGLIRFKIVPHLKPQIFRGQRSCPHDLSINISETHEKLMWLIFLNK